jgi:hypothetical protein
MPPPTSSGVAPTNPSPGVYGWGGGREPRRATGPVRHHLVAQLGEPFSVLTERVAKLEWIDVAGFSLGGNPDVVAMITDGLADFARRHDFAGPNDEAQELVLLIEGSCLNQATLDFFVRVAAVYADEHRQLGQSELIRLSSAVPAAKACGTCYPLRLRYRTGICPQRTTPPAD